MLAEHPDLPAADDVITVREELARGQTVGARQTEREREREKCSLCLLFSSSFMPHIFQNSIQPPKCSGSQEGS